MRDRRIGTIPSTEVQGSTSQIRAPPRRLPLPLPQEHSKTMTPEAISVRDSMEGKELWKNKCILKRKQLKSEYNDKCLI